MKSIFLYFLIILIAPLTVRAGHNENVRSSCHWWRAKYRTECHLGGPGVMGGIFQLFGWDQSTDRGCNWAYSNVADPGSCGKPLKASSTANASANTGQVYVPCKLNWGGIPSPLFTELEGDNNDEPIRDVPENGTQETSFNPIFENDHVAVREIAVHLELEESSPRENVFTLAVWLPKDDIINYVEDSVYTQDKAISYGNVSIIKGRLVVEGDMFDNNDFRISKNGTTTVVDYVGGDKVVYVNCEDPVQDVIVTGLGDIKDNESKLFSKVASSGNGIINGFDNDLSIHPNPSASSSIFISLMSKEEDKIKISIFDAMGKVVIGEQDLRIFQGLNENIPIDISTLSKGTYYMLSKGKGFKNLKQFVKL